MSKVFITDTLLTSIADAIRSKLGITDTIKPSEMAGKIEELIDKDMENAYVDRTLTSISLPVATSIGNYAFRGCSALTEVSLPAATSIGGNAFYSCSALTSIHFAAANQATIEALSSYSSKWGATNATIYFDL